MLGERANTSEKNCRDAFILREYLASTLRLKTVVRLSNCESVACDACVSMRSVRAQYFMERPHARRKPDAPRI